MLRVTSEWTGFLGAPGYTNFYFDAFAEQDRQAVVDSVRAFWEGVSNWLPATVRIRVLGEVAIVNHLTGEVDAFQQLTSPTQVSGIGQGAYSSATGAAVTWLTDGVRAGRKVRGRTFIVPMAGAGAFDSDGSLGAAALTGINSAANTLLTNRALIVWCRPTAGAGVGDGAKYEVTAQRVVDKPAVLRSRRD